MKTLVSKSNAVNSIGLQLKLDLPFAAVIRPGMDASKIEDPAERQAFADEAAKEGFLIEVNTGLSSLWIRCDQQVSGPAKVLYLECVTAKTKTKGLAFRPVRLLAVDIDGSGDRVQLSKPRGGSLIPEDEHPAEMAPKPAQSAATAPGTSAKK